MKDINKLSPYSSNVFTKTFKSVNSDEYTYSIKADPIFWASKITCQVTVMRTTKKDTSIKTSKINKDDPNISIRFSTIKYREKHRASREITIAAGTSEYFEIAIEDSREIKFDKGNNIGTSHAFNIPFYTAAIETSLNRSTGVSHGENILINRGKTLDGDFCDRWRITYYVTRRIAYLNSSTFNDGEEIPFTYTEAMDIETIPLCKGKSLSSYIELFTSIKINS